MTAPLFTWNEIAALTSGTWLLPTSKTSNGPSLITDDSRLAKTDSLFLAIDGRTYGLAMDGHAFLKSAAAQGAAVLLCQEDHPFTDELTAQLHEKGSGLLQVKDTLKAYHALAAAWRAKYKIPLVGVTGSCGKTSTKEMVAAVLNARYPGNVLKTTGNTNNFFGVPRNLFRLNSATEAAVIEMGSNHPGEIQELSSMTRPTVSIISCIGAAHLEFFHDLQGVAEEKGDLFQNTAENGVCILPDVCEGKEKLLSHAGTRRVLTFGATPTSDVQATFLGYKDGAFQVQITLPKQQKQCQFSWQIPGACQALNAAGAVAAGMACGLSLEECAKGLANCQLPGARMAECDAAGCHWMNDAYNANPTSMREALQAFRDAAAKAPRRLIILGDMLELGSASPQFHREILEFTKKLFPSDTILTVGKCFRPHAEALHIPAWNTVQEMIGHIPLLPGTWIFLKASNSIGLHRLISLCQPTDSTSQA